MILAYMDESGTHTSSRAVAVGGYLARWEQWNRFQTAWGRLLKHYNLRELHMKHAAHFRREFEGWKEERRAAFLAEAALVIKRHTMLALGCGFVTADYDASDTVDKYFLCLHGAVHFLLANLARSSAPLRLRVGEKISFVFDQRRGFEGAAQKVFAYLRSRHQRGRLLGNIVFSDSIICPPLQAADFFAYEITKSLGKLCTTG